MHGTWNIIDHVGPSNRAPVAAMLKTIFAQESEAAAIEQSNDVADALLPKP